MANPLTDAPSRSTSPSPAKSAVVAVVAVAVSTVAVVVADAIAINSIVCIVEASVRGASMFLPGRCRIAGLPVRVEAAAAIGKELDDLSDPHMQKLKGLLRAVINAVTQAWLLLRSVATATRRRRQQAVLKEREAERLDRIRNPSKYLGK